MSDQAAPAPEPVAPAEQALETAPESAVVPDEIPAEPVVEAAPEVVAEPAPEPVVEDAPEAQPAELLDYREPENVLARGNIVSDGPGTVGA